MEPFSNLYKSDIRISAQLDEVASSYAQNIKCSIYIFDTIKIFYFSVYSDSDEDNLVIGKLFRKSIEIPNDKPVESLNDLIDIDDIHMATDYSIDIPRMTQMFALRSPSEIEISARRKVSIDPALPSCQFDSKYTFFEQKTIHTS